MLSIKKLPAVPDLACRPLCDSDIMNHLHTTRRRNNDMCLMQKRDSNRKVFFKKIHLSGMRR